MTLKDLEAVIDECTGISKPAAARTELQKQNLANILGVMRFPESLLVRHMQAGTFLFREIGERTTHGRNAFSNVGVRYCGSSNDDELNRDVVRFAADPEALAALKVDGAPTGTPAIPVLSIHSINDPQVAVEVQSAYRDPVHAAGNGDRLVQAYTDENAHTAQSAPELAAALDALMQWIEKGIKPTRERLPLGASACARPMMVCVDISRTFAEALQHAIRAHGRRHAVMSSVVATWYDQSGAGTARTRWPPPRSDRFSPSSRRFRGRKRNSQTFMSRLFSDFVNARTQPANTTPHL